MSEKNKLFNDFIYDLVNFYQVDVSWDKNKIFISKVSEKLAIDKIKTKAKELKINFKTKRNYIEFVLD